MVSKSEVKYIQSLYQKKNRIEEGLFVVEGPKLVGETLHSAFQVETVYAVKEWLEANPKVVATEVTVAELEKLSHHQTPNQVLAVVKQQEPAGEPELQGHLALVLDGIQDPGNLGTIIRIADWFGVRQIIASEDTVELYNPKVIQSTMGSFLRVKVWYKKLDYFMPGLPVPVYGALLNGENVFQMKSVQEGVLVIGNESKGIREGVMPFVTNAVTIPRIGEAESLNAAVATGILLSHLVQQ